MWSRDQQLQLQQLNRPCVSAPAHHRLLAASGAQQRAPNPPTPNRQTRFEAEQRRVAGLEQTVAELQRELDALRGGGGGGAVGAGQEASFMRRCSIGYLV